MNKNKTCVAFSKRPRPQGLTVVEVLASISLLSTLLVGMLLAFSRHREQLERSAQRLAATQAADELLANWHTRMGAFPYSDQGACGTQQEFMWRTQTLSQPRRSSLGIEVVRLEVFAAKLPESRTAAPLLQVDLALPQR